MLAVLALPCRVCGGTRFLSTSDARNKKYEVLTVVDLTTASSVSVLRAMEPFQAGSTYVTLVGLSLARVRVRVRSRSLVRLSLAFFCSCL